MNNRIIPYILIITILTVFTAGCVSKIDNENEIVMWLVGSEAQAKKIMDLSVEFTEKTGKTVLCQSISWDSAHSKYLTSIAGDVTPDIATMGLTWGMEFGALGAMVDLRDRFPEDVSGLEKRNFPGIVESTKVGKKMYGVPLDMSEYILYYRTDIIPKAPSTWLELMDILKELKTKDKSMIMDWGSLVWIGFAPFLWQAGGDFFNSDYSEITLDTPQAAEALRFLARLYKEGVPKTTVPLELGMRTGDYPMAISGNWKIISLALSAPEIKGKWAIAPLPAGPSGKRTAFIGGRIMGIFSNSKKVDESWEFIKFLSRPDIQKKLYEASRETQDAYLPSNMDTWKDLSMESKFKKALEKQARDAKGPPPVLGWDSMSRFVNQAVQMVVLKNADPATELKKAQISMKKEFDEAKR